MVLDSLPKIDVCFNNVPGEFASVVLHQPLLIRSGKSPSALAIKEGSHKNVASSVNSGFHRNPDADGSEPVESPTRCRFTSRDSQKPSADPPLIEPRSRGNPTILSYRITT